MERNIICAKIIIEGKVQGIGYRWFVKNIADEEKVKGYVKNNYDGSVEVVAECENKDILEKFIKRIKIEHPYAIVSEVKILFFQPKYYKNFTIEL